MYDNCRSWMIVAWVYCIILFSYVYIWNFPYKMSKKKKRPSTKRESLTIKCIHGLLRKIKEIFKNLSHPSKNYMKLYILSIRALTKFWSSSRVRGRPTWDHSILLNFSWVLQRAWSQPWDGGAVDIWCLTEANINPF